MRLHRTKRIFYLLQCTCYTFMSYFHVDLVLLIQYVTRLYCSSTWLNLLLHNLKLFRGVTPRWPQTAFNLKIKYWPLFGSSGHQIIKHEPLTYRCNMNILSFRQSVSTLISGDYPHVTVPAIICEDPINDQWNSFPPSLHEYGRVCPRCCSQVDYQRTKILVF